jgi:hypothetical protein
VVLLDVVLAAPPVGAVVADVLVCVVVDELAPGVTTTAGGELDVLLVLAGGLTTVLCTVVGGGDSSEPFSQPARHAAVTAATAAKPIVNRFLIRIVHPPQDGTNYTRR